MIVVRSAELRPSSSWKRDPTSWIDDVVDVVRQHSAMASTMPGVIACFHDMDRRCFGPRARDVVGRVCCGKWCGWRMAGRNVYFIDHVLMTTI